METACGAVLYTLRHNVSDNVHHRLTIVSKCRYGSQAHDVLLMRFGDNTLLESAAALHEQQK